MKKVAVIMGSDSDFPVVSKAVAELKAYGVPYECHVMSAHRTPALASDFADKAKENGFGVIICAAGMAAHLAGVIAGHTTLPVIGIPCKVLTSTAWTLCLLPFRCLAVSLLPLSLLTALRTLLYLLFRCLLFLTRVWLRSLKRLSRI